MSTFCERTNSSDVSWCKKWILALAIVQTLSMGKSFLFMTGKGDGDAAMLFNIVTVIAVILFLLTAGLRLAVMRLFFQKPEMWPLIQLGSFAISMALLGWFYHFLIGLLTIVPVKFFSGESLFGEEENDYLVMPQK